MQAKQCRKRPSFAGPFVDVSLMDSRGLANPSVCMHDTWFVVAYGKRSPSLSIAHHAITHRVASLMCTTLRRARGLMPQHTPNADQHQATAEHDPAIHKEALVIIILVLLCTVSCLVILALVTRLPVGALAERRFATRVLLRIQPGR